MGSWKNDAWECLSSFLKDASSPLTRLVLGPLDTKEAEHRHRPLLFEAGTLGELDAVLSGEDYQNLRMLEFSWLRATKAQLEVLHKEKVLERIQRRWMPQLHARKNMKFKVGNM